MIKETIDSGKCGCGVFIDVRKAFDTVNHEILLIKSEHYGTRGNMLNWSQSYLSTVNNMFHLMDIPPNYGKLIVGIPKDQS